MEVILREDVEKVGAGGEVVDVADGYARNFLFPRGLAEKATNAKIQEVQAARKAKEKAKAESREAAQAQAEKLEAEKFEIAVKAGEEGRLFGSVSTHDIADKVEAAGYEIDRKKIDLEENIKDLGTHKVPVKLFEDITAELTVNVVAKEEE
ncbi:MAG: 50S ribosomal protein L9 [Halarsenatibacteraceae bacterium]